MPALKFGKRRAPLGLRLKLGSYLSRAFQPAPRVIDWSPKAMAQLQRMFLNDQISCCTAASKFHSAGMMLANADFDVTFTDEQVREFYSLCSGYVDGQDSTDNGAAMKVVMDAWLDHGLSNNLYKIDGYVAINAADPEEVRAALYYFGNVSIGMELPDEWVNPTPTPETVWGLAGPPNPQQGHEFCICGANDEGVRPVTWGMLLKNLTWPALAQYGSTNGGEVYTAISADSLNRLTLLNPAGLDYAQLISDFRIMAGTVAV